MTKFYTGIGSRETPKIMLTVMTALAQMLDKRDYVLRSGGADGADTAFAAGATKKVIYIPWQKFNGVSDGVVMGHSEIHREVAAKIHPAWSNCSDGARKLHTRNVAQVLGDDLKTPSKFLICWTPGGTAEGGSATAINLALKHNIPVFFLNKWAPDKILDYITRMP